MQVNVQPVMIVDNQLAAAVTGGSTWHVFPQPNFQIAVLTDIAAAQAAVEGLHRMVQERLRSDANFLQPVVVRNTVDADAVRQHLTDVDALLINISCGVPEPLWACDIPIIAFSGEQTPMMGLYTCPPGDAERHPNVVLALDVEEIRDQIRLLEVKKRLAHSRVVILGEYFCPERLPAAETAERRLGVKFDSVSRAEFLERITRVDEQAAQAVARQWVQGATGPAESLEAEVAAVARAYVALEGILRDKDAQAVSVGCLEIMYAGGHVPFCFVLAQLRDIGLPAGCEGDMTATLTMLLLEYLADRPAYMGNLVKADPHTNQVSISHGCSPARMAGRNQPAKPYRLVHSHSAPPFSRDLSHGAGVTSYVDYGDVGQEVTVTRLGADLDRLMAARAEIVECRDTICDRTTLTVRVRDARDFVHKAMGNHQVVIYGNVVPQLEALCRLIGLRFIEA